MRFCWCTRTHVLLIQPKKSPQMAVAANSVRRLNVGRHFMNLFRLDLQKRIRFRSVAESDQTFASENG